jgi:hypothetical protein
VFPVRYEQNFIYYSEEDESPVPIGGPQSRCGSSGDEEKGPSISLTLRPQESIFLR